MESALNGDENLIESATRRIFFDLCEPQTVNSAKDNSWKKELWSALAGSGLTHSWVPDSMGGPGTSMEDGFRVLRIAGSFAVPVALAETMLAGWLLAHAGISLPEGALSLAPCRPNDEFRFADGRISGQAAAVPFAREAKHLAVLAKSGEGNVVALVAMDDCTCEHGQSLANDPLDAVALQGVRPIAVAAAPDGIDRQAVLLMGSVARASQTAGALEHILARSVAYSQERVAFEKTISRFQAVQQNLARLAGETAAAIAAAGSAAEAISSGIDWNSPALLLEAVSARIRSAEAAQEGAAIAHQIHGAIGITAEYVLHRFTLRALSWRDDFGNESYWATVLGHVLASRGADRLWPLIASR